MPGLCHEDMSLTAHGMLLHSAFLSKSQCWEVDRQEAYQLELCGKLLECIRQVALLGKPQKTGAKSKCVE